MRAPLGAKAALLGDFAISSMAAAMVRNGVGAQSLMGTVPPLLLKFRRALKRQENGGAFVRFALVGDSTTAGAISGAVSSDNRPLCWGARLAALLTEGGMPACMTNAIGNAQGATGGGIAFNNWDSRLSSTGAFAVASSNQMAGGLSTSTPGSAGSVSFTPGVSSDTVDLYFYDQTGSFNVNVDGGATIQTVALTNTSLPRKVTVTYPAGVHTINVVWVSGTFNFLGFDAYTAASPQVHLLNLGSGGATATTLSANATAFDPIRWYRFFAPDLSIISLGINDWIAGTALSTYTTNLQTIITACLLSGDVILMTPFPSQISQATLANQALYVAAVRALAAQNGLLLIDENANLISWDAMNARSLTSDVNHPNGAGHAVIARDIKNAVGGWVP